MKQNKEEKCKKQERQGGGKSMSKGEDKQREGGQEKESAWRYTHTHHDDTTFREAGNMREK